jgi:hypothetical protein
LIGKAQLHHAHYKITLLIREGTYFGLHQTGLTRDFFIDHNHFCMIDAKHESESGLGLEEK